MSQRGTLGNRLAPGRFVLFLALLAAAFAALWTTGVVPGWQKAATAAFDLAALVFLISLIPLFRDGSARAIRVHARDNDANRVLVLVITVLLTLVAMAAIAGEMPGAQAHQALPLAKLLGTLLLIWLFANTVFTLHYAHAFYSAEPGTGRDAGGLEFAGTKTPGYGDFAYFAFTLGMTFQTSDVVIAAPAIRRVALFHCFAAFVFNLGVIAFTINALGGK